MAGDYRYLWRSCYRVTGVVDLDNVAVQVADMEVDKKSHSNCNSHSENSKMTENSQRNENSQRSENSKRNENSFKSDLKR